VGYNGGRWINVGKSGEKVNNFLINKHKNHLINQPKETHANRGISPLNR